MNAPALEVTEARVNYGRFEIVHGVSFAVQPGEIVALLGANGAGKSSLLKAISGVVPLRSGAVQLAGQDITETSGRDRWRAGLRLVPEGRELFPSLTVLENLRVAAFHERRRRALVRSEIEGVLDLFPKLRERARQITGTLSGGEQQMLVAARALLFSPSVVLFDEISLGLAPVVVSSLYEILMGCVRERGTAVVMVEELFDEVRRFADRGFLMRMGRIDELDVHTTSAAGLVSAYLSGT